MNPATMNQLFDFSVQACPMNPSGMGQLPDFFVQYYWLFLVIIPLLALWDGVWKAISMWKAARNNHLAWFICLCVFNTIGILPIIYILTHKKKCE